MTETRWHRMFDESSMTGTRVISRVTPDIRLVSGYPAYFSGIWLSSRIAGDIRSDSRIIT